MTSTGRVDVAVIGGGPAGAAAAHLLASWGRSVLLLTGPLRGRQSLAESLPPSCRKPLAAAGLLHAVDGAGFIESTGNTAAWGGGPPRSERFAGGATGYQVLRSELDALLLDRAAGAGAMLVRGGIVRDVRLGAEVDGRTLVAWTCAAPGERPDTGGPGALGSAARAGHSAGASHPAGTAAARWVLDCSGHAGVLARRGMRRADAVPSTLALIGTWRRPDAWPLEDPSHTVVESYRDGWAWSVPVAADRRCVAVMVDRRRTALPAGASLADSYLAELRKTTLLSHILAGATPDAPPFGHGAAPYGAADCAGDGFLLVGDAASFLDPLSSAGVTKALASAFLAAVTVNTCMASPHMQERALSLYRERERAAHHGYTAIAAAHYATAAAYHDHPFWHTRAAAAVMHTAPKQHGTLDHGTLDHGSLLNGTLDQSTSVLGQAASDIGLMRDPRVAAAYEALRATPVHTLRPAARLERGLRAAVGERQVIMEERLVSPAAPDGIRYFRGIDLTALVDLTADHHALPQLFEAYQRRTPVRLPDFVGAVSALVALGMLDAVPGSTEPGDS